MNRWQTTVAAVIGAIGAIGAALIVTLGGNSSAPVGSGTGSVPSSTGSGPVLGGPTLTIWDDVNGGVWALTAPTEPRLYGRDHRPANARRWFINGVIVPVRCVRRAQGYPVIDQGQTQRWYWWAELDQSQLWVPMGGLKEPKIDGPSGEPICAS